MPDKGKQRYAPLRQYVADINSLRSELAAVQARLADQERALMLMGHQGSHGRHGPLEAMGSA